jgi:hypothetical protein
MAYIVWSIPSATAFAEYQTEGEALAFVREAITKNGPGYAEDWLLAYENRRGDAHEVAKGAALVERARASALREALEHIAALADPGPKSGPEHATLAAIRRAAHTALAQGTTRRRAS